MKKQYVKKQAMKNQHGAGLIELMVSIAIGLLLVLGVSTVFLSVNKTFKDRKGLAELQNSERLAMSFISAGIHNAGYYPDPLAASPIVINQALVGTEGGTADTLTIQFVAPLNVTSVSAFQGCNALLTPNHTYADTFSVSAGYLVCAEKDITTNTTAPNVNLISGLTDINITYGEDTNGAGSVTTYRNATAVATWGAVKTVKVTLSFTNPLFGQPGQIQKVSLTQTISNLVGP